MSNTSDPKLEESIYRVLDRLLKMPKEELMKELEKHKDGDVARAYQDLSGFSEFLQKENEGEDNV